MIGDFVYGLPLWALGLFISAASLSCVGVSVLVVRWRAWVLDADDMGSAAVLHAFVSVVYAVALGLIVVNVQTDFSAVEDAVRGEASKLGHLYRDLGGLDEPDRGRLQTQVRRYVDLVVDEEWPAGNRGEQSETTMRAIDDLARGVIEIHLSAPDAQALKAALIQDVDDVLDERRKRISLGQAGMSSILWLIIIAGGGITIGFAAMFPMRRVGRQIAVLSLAAMMLAMMIFLVVAMDRPLRGQFSVPPDPFHELRARIV